MGNLKYYLPGGILILTAMLIVAVPEILVAMVAALIIMAGVGALVIGHMIRKSETEFRNMDNGFSRNRPFGGRFMKMPLFRDQYREF